jgi:HD-GYP domain-containing protein (c-di-GMP phosphodiesterase class II)
MDSKKRGRIQKRLRDSRIGCFEEVYVKMFEEFSGAYAAISSVKMSPKQVLGLSLTFFYEAIPYIDDNDKLKAYAQNIGQLLSNIAGDELAFTQYKQVLSHEDRHFLDRAEEEGEKLVGKIDVANMQKVLIALDRNNKKISTAAHCRRVAKYTKKLCAGLGIDNGEELMYKAAANLHDIGMIGTPQIYESRILTEDERKQMERHTLVGQFILTRDGNGCLADGAAFHHERWDGNGYPYRKKGVEIPFVASLIVVADAYDSMTSGRPWKQKMGSEESIDEIVKEAGKQFNPEIAKQKILDHIAA